MPRRMSVWPVAIRTRTPGSGVSRAFPDLIGHGVLRQTQSTQ